MVSGSCDDYDCEYDWQYGYDEDEDEDEHHSIGDEIDSSLSLEHVVDLDGSLRLADVDITEDDIIQLEPFEGREPDNEDFQGFTGNEGATTTHWYRNSVGGQILTLMRAPVNLTKIGALVIASSTVRSLYHQKQVGA